MRGTVLVQTAVPSRATIIVADVLQTKVTVKQLTIDELRAWLEENWDPDLTVGEWWDRLGMAGWAAPMLPEDCYGRGLSRGDALLVTGTIARFGALGAKGILQSIEERGVHGSTFLRG